MAAAAAMRQCDQTRGGEQSSIALGTDAGVVPHGTNTREFLLMVEWGGMSNMDAIVAATSRRSKAVGLGEKRQVR